jgi:hypothetical protein
MTYGCWIPLFRRQREHHILVGPPDHPFGVGGHSHIQLGVCCTCLVVSFDVRRGLEEWPELQPQREHFLVTRSYRHNPQVCAQLLFNVHIFC